MDLLINTLGPVLLMSSTGWLARRWGLLQAQAIGPLTDVVFKLLTPALLFRTMSHLGVAGLSLRTIATYFAGVLLVYLLVLLKHRHDSRAAVYAIASTFSNLVMIGIPIVTFSFGQEGLYILLMLIAVHALILLTLTTVALEWSLTQQASSNTHQAWWRQQAVNVYRAAKATLIHPVPLPILAGLAFAATGLHLPQMIDQSLLIMGQANGPMSLILVGASLSGEFSREAVRKALGLVLTKIVLMPIVVTSVCYFSGLRGLPLAILSLAASMPIGANAFLFSQRYQMAQQEVTTGIAISTLATTVTLGFWLTVANWLKVLP